jgi:valyl-tRNA synthetase
MNSFLLFRELSAHMIMNWQNQGCRIYFHIALSFFGVLVLQIYNHWLTNIKDWCISRQLWWGHRIPVWYIVGKKCEEDYIVARTEEEAIAEAHEKYGKSVEIYQDPDVLDTWFSRSVFLCEICGPNCFSALCISLLHDYIFICKFGVLQGFLL